MVNLRPAVRSLTLALHPKRSFSSSTPKLDLSKVTLIGRLGQDPILRHTTSGKPYYTYSIATASGTPREEDGSEFMLQITPPNTSWHSVFAFNEHSHPAISRVGKGSTVYVEADLEMRPAQSSDGQQLHDRALLRHVTMRVINRVRPEEEEGAEVEEE